MASSLCGCTLLLLALLPVLRAAAAAGSDGGGLAASESAEPDAEEGIRVLEADVPRLGDCIRIGEQVIRCVHVLGLRLASAAGIIASRMALLPQVQAGGAGGQQAV